MTNFEMLGRERKAASIAQAAESFGITSSDAAQSIDDEPAWAQLAREAGYPKPPSAETRRIVVQMLMSREG